MEPGINVEGWQNFQIKKCGGGIIFGVWIFPKQNYKCGGAQNLFNKHGGRKSQIMNTQIYVVGFVRNGFPLSGSFRQAGP